MKTTKVIYGSYKEEEIALIEELFNKYGVPYEITSHWTNRKLLFFHLTAECETGTFYQIRKDLNERIRRKWNWGRMNFREMA